MKVLPTQIGILGKSQQGPSTVYHQRCLIDCSSLVSVAFELRSIRYRSCCVIGRDRDALRYFEEKAENANNARCDF